MIRIRTTSRIPSPTGLCTECNAHVATWPIVAPADGFTVKVRLRVPATGTLQRWVNGAWQNVQFSGTYSGTVSGTGRLTFPAMSFSNPPQYTGRFPYRIRVSLVWQNYYTGATLGAENIVPSTYADNQCATRFIACRSYTDSIVM